MSDRGGVVEIAHLVVSGATMLVVVALGAKLILGGGVAPDALRVPIDQMRFSSYTNVEAAHITITNMNHATAWTCMRAVITTKTGAAVQSVPVCTGDIKPHSTVVLEAPYSIGAVVKLCPDDDTRGRNVDWSKCEFNVEDAK